MKNPLKSTDLLKKAGVNCSLNAPPEEIYHILITSVIKIIPCGIVANFLRENGHQVSNKQVMKWQQYTREWLGLPPVGRGKVSIQYRNKIEEWLEANGNPSLKQIDAGWTPERKCNRNKPVQHAQYVTRSTQRDILEFWGMMRYIKRADDNEVGARGKELLKLIEDMRPNRISHESPH